MKHTEYLKYTFTESELKEFAKELARQTATMSEVEEEKKAVVANFTERIAAAKSNASRLSRYINNGYDYRNIDCSVKLNDPNTGVKTIYRDDTGESVKTYPMTQDELQEKLPL